MSDSVRQHPRAGSQIELRALSKRYGDKLAVDALSFDVRPGLVTGFLGPNGAGKTTTMRLILGLDHATSGEVTVGGHPYGDLPAPLHEVGAVIDAQGVHPKRTAYHHLLALAQSNGIAARRVDEVLGLVGLDGAAQRRVGTFSLGMSQRLGIGAAMLGDPPVLLFDEPVNGLDPEGIVWVRQLMRSLAAEGRTVFVSSHLMAEMTQTADHLIVIGKGTLLRDEGITEFLGEDTDAWVLVRGRPLDELAARLGAAGAQVRPGPDASIEVSGLDATAIGELAARNGLVLHELSPRRASLEDAFMQLTRDSVEYHAGTLS